MNAPARPVRLLPAAVDGLDRAVASGDLTAMAAADRVLHAVLSDLDPAADVAEALHASLRRAEQALLAARAAASAEMRRLGDEMEALQRQRVGTQAYASHEQVHEDGA